MTINSVIENQIVNNNTTTVKGKTNSEMYNYSRRGNFECYWFSYDGVNDFKSTSFAKAKDYTLAHLDNWGSGEIDNYIKINGLWYYVTKEQLTNLFSSDCEEIDEAIDDYLKDNIIDELPTTLDGLVDKFINDDAYATKLLDDGAKDEKTMSELHACISCGLVERYDRFTGKQLSDLYQLIITMKLIDNRMNDIVKNSEYVKYVDWDGVADGLYDAQLKCDDAPCTDKEYFKTKTFPTLIAMAKAKANSMAIAI